MEDYKEELLNHGFKESILSGIYEISHSGITYRTYYDNIMQRHRLIASYNGDTIYFSWHIDISSMLDAIEESDNAIERIKDDAVRKVVCKLNELA